MNEQIKKDRELIEKMKLSVIKPFVIEPELFQDILEAQARVTTYETEKKILKLSNPNQND